MRWIADNLDVIGGHLANHLLLALPPIVASFLLAIPIGALATRIGWLRAPLLSAAGLLYAIPSLPLFVVLPLVIGTGVRDSINIVVALTLYGLALMVPATADALRQVDPRVIDAADALGYGRLRRFLAIELPVAGPTLLAGLRVVAVSTVSLVTVGAVLGVPSLGMLFTDGFARGIMPAIGTGIVLTIALALLLDGLLVLLGRLILPWTRRAPRVGVATPDVVAPAPEGEGSRA
ncbi:MAG: ABC transporter permease subunit [Propionibacteriaceae bacterium]|nr:ABC transporter permease subunit [Propionibacteriaceae bacterium]